ncbi:VOC family protein [Endozoicomonas sp.]|uniref:VOC family protein n=1 Tax=Endozoicomonas sp. TaxID=1892382 RepID=UPI00383BB91F
MEITLNHTIVPAHDKVASARFYERIFGFQFLQVWKGFAVLKVNSTLTLDFRDATGFSSLHYAFKVTDRQFDEILGRIRAENRAYGSGPASVDNDEINHSYGGRGVYFKDPNGHVLEIITADYILD